ncbi:hypothetical protein Rrhod_3249 [Rhodococcus rhodnii LMG 5362]|uniref:Uncharacterized protein n=1 Tax=Rhodococcus rhodnii LMG 5362 TaxID=1273125 RepID=R7WJH5_9NOCA|nr:hypothetical protein Rrhod_3249 [Rhodococcus rhodnii LMG 5362]
MRNLLLHLASGPGVICVESRRHRSHRGRMRSWQG